MDTVTVEEVLYGTEGRSGLPSDDPAYMQTDLYVPEVVMKKWKRDPSEIYLLFEELEKVFREVLHMPMTDRLMRGELPERVHCMWQGMYQKGWVEGEIPAYKLSKSLHDPSVIYFEWPGRLVVVRTLKRC